MKTGRLKMATAFTTLYLGITGLATAAAPMESARPRAQATTVPDSAWVYQKESGHDFECGDTDSGSTGHILIGRGHDGDENDHTSYLCANVRQFEVLPEPGDEETRENPLPDGIRFTCSVNKVLVGRKHEGDENEPEHLRCGSVKDIWGNLMNVIPGPWNGPYKENDHQYVCPANSVLIGKYHRGDENGDTEYQCGTLW